MMTRKIIINPRYAHLKDFVEHIPERFLSEGECIYDARNKIKVFAEGDIKLNVKRYSSRLFSIVWPICI